jgi:Na+-translocating ferredoxin:NAD+ oxidoreductase RnfG subunit
MKRRDVLRLVPAGFLLAAAPAIATTYLSVEEAQQSMFPGRKLTKAFFRLSDDQVHEIEKRSETNVREREVRLWRVEGGGAFLVDEVVGKHEFITYALALDADGSVRQIEILDYRESYGYQIRNAEWRRQFVGKRAGDPVRLKIDIRNISGATLSCKNVSNGIRRLLATYEIAVKAG